MYIYINIYIYIHIYVYICIERVKSGARVKQSIHGGGDSQPLASLHSRRFPCNTHVKTRRWECDRTGSRTHYLWVSD